MSFNRFLEHLAPLASSSEFRLATFVNVGAAGIIVGIIVGLYVSFQVDFGEAVFAATAVVNVVCAVQLITVGAFLMVSALRGRL
ncbi:hypothetical protein [Sphingomonas sp. DT-204]|uniref:hypothetical protein n=1 Tax=Sphingomonas sp. DT-204 TaxID=3396166 RepID=UPI003F1B1D2F